MGLAERRRPKTGPAWHSFLKNRPVFPATNLRRLHLVDGLNQCREIKILDGPGESLRADEESPRRHRGWLKNVGVLNLGNYDFPHTVMSFLAGVPIRNARGVDHAGGGNSNLNPPSGARGARRATTRRISRLIMEEPRKLAMVQRNQKLSILVRLGSGTFRMVCGFAFTGS